MGKVAEIFDRVVTFMYGQTGPRGRHTGIDLRSRTPETLGAPVTGTVVELRDYDPGSSYGRYVVVEDDAAGVRHLLAHLSSVSVRAGQRVVQGQVIGQSGSSGGVDPHLHYEVRVNRNGRWVDVDPRPHMRYNVFEPMAPAPPGAPGDGAAMPIVFNPLNPWGLDLNPFDGDGLDLNPIDNIMSSFQKASYWFAFMIFAFGLIAMGAYLFFKPELKGAAKTATKAAAVIA